jgi:hypothetical protein
MASLTSEIRLTKRILAAIKRRIREVEGSEDDEVADYYRPYASELEHAVTKSIDSKDFVALARKAKVVLVGDYHTLDQAQLTLVRLLKDLKEAGRKPTVALEMVNAHHQSALDRYLARKLDDRDFLEEIDYFRHWGFDFSHYKPIFDFARENRLALYGLNREGTLEARDRFMAKRLKELSSEESFSGPLLVLVGDLHLATPHLPASLKELGCAPLVLFQNSETVYMRKLCAGQEPFGWWSLGRNRFLNNNTPPTVKLMTNIVWLEHGGEALQMLYGYRRGNSQDEGADLAETVRGYIRALKAIFDLRYKTDDDFQVFMYTDLSFLKNSFFKTAPGRFYKSVIADGRALYIDHNRTIYLPMLDVNRTVQEAMHYLMRAELPTGRSVKAFMGRIHYFTSGYLASKLINPMRHSPTLKEMEEVVRAYTTLNKQKERLKLGRQFLVYHGVLEFFRQVRSRSSKLQVEMAPLLEADQRTSFALSEQIGRTLGDELYALHDEGRLSAVELKTYCFSQNDPLRYERNGRISESA